MHTLERKRKELKRKEGSQCQTGWRGGEKTHHLTIVGNKLIRSILIFFRDAVICNSLCTEMVS